MPATRNRTRRRPSSGTTPRTTAQLEKILDRLPGLEKVVLDRRYGITGGHPTPRADIAAELDLTTREVGEIEARALTRLRDIVDTSQLTRLLTALTDHRS